MPGEDGLSTLVCPQAGSSTRDIPVIMVTARGSELDEVRGLDPGAEEYICQAFWHGLTVCTRAGKAVPSHAKAACRRTAR